MLSFFIPLLITTSQSIYGWNASYASSVVPEMQERAFRSLERIAKEKCKEGVPEFLSRPEYSYHYTGAYYVEHAFVYIQCGRNP